MESVRLSLDIYLFLVLCILLSCLDKVNSCLLISGGFPKVSVFYAFCDIVVQHFHDSWEVSSLPFHDRDVYVLVFCIEFCIPQVV